MKDSRRGLRQESTLQERRLWLRLKNKQLGVRFRRQYSIGNYIADFCSPRNKLVIELEGGVHDEEEQRCYDRERKQTIEDIGFKVLTFNNNEVEKDIGKVISYIKKNLN